MSIQLLEVNSLIKLTPCYLHNFFYSKHNAQGLLMFTIFGVVNFFKERKEHFVQIIAWQVTSLYLPTINFLFLIELH